MDWVVLLPWYWKVRKILEKHMSTQLVYYIIIVLDFDSTGGFLETPVIQDFPRNQQHGGVLNIS